MESGNDRRWLECRRCLVFTVVNVDDASMKLGTELFIGFFVGLLEFGHNVEHDEGVVAKGFVFLAVFRHHAVAADEHVFKG